MNFMNAEINILMNLTLKKPKTLPLLRKDLRKSSYLYNIKCKS